MITVHSDNAQGYFFVIAELQCTGFEHVPVNAAFVLMMCHAYPEKKFLLIAEKNHMEQLHAKLTPYNLKNLDTSCIIINTKKLSPARRLIPDFIAIFNLLKLMHHYGTQRIMLLSVNTTLLLALKLLVITRYKSIKALVIPHSILASITDPLPLRPWYWLLRFKIVLKSLNVWNIHYLLLGPSIKKNLDNELPSLSTYCSVINHPYLVDKNELNIKFNGKIIFAYLGVAHNTKGFDTFLSVASHLKLNSNQNAIDDFEFICIGSLVSDSLYKDAHLYVRIPCSEKHLSDKDYNNLCNQMTYSVLPYKTNSYRFYPSGAVFDSLVHFKPIICLRNPYFEYLFELMGDIGYLCDDIDQMTHVIQNIVISFPAERYVNQCRNIKEGVQFFNPLNLVKNIRYIVKSGLLCG